MNLVLKIAVSAALVLCVMWFIDLRSLVDAFSTLSLASAAAAVTAYAIMQVFGSLKWHVLLRSITVLELLRANLVGLFYLTLLPGQLFGEIAKAYFVCRTRDQRSQIVASVVVDKVAGLLALLSIAVIGVAFGEIRAPGGLLAVLVAMLCTLIVMVCVLASNMAYRLMAWVSSWTQDRRRVSILISGLSSLHAAFGDYKSRPAAVFAAVVLCLIFQCINIAVALILAHGYGISVSFFDMAWIFTAVALAMQAPISVGGIGIREGMFVGLLSSLGFEGSAALAMSLSLLLLQVFAALVGAVAHWQYRGAKHSAQAPNR